jgi:DNA helicase IV
MRSSIGDLTNVKVWTCADYIQRTSKMTESILPTTQAANKIFVSGPFGGGKTTLAIDRIRWLLRRERTRGDDILVLTAQRTLSEPFTRALRNSETPSGPPVRVTTFAGLARNAVELYWPLLASVVGFADPKREPTFLNLETSQYHMARLVDEALEQGEFDSIRIERNRVISQVLDNLNKAALQGFTIDEAYQRLELAVPSGEQRTGRLNALRAAQRISHAFRKLCLDVTLIDFSMQVELFNRHVLTNDWSRTHLFRSHRHLIFDNIE